jgi:hypothetical protein
MSSYFSHFPSISYDIEGNLNAKEIIATNIFAKFSLSDKIMDNTLIYYKYDVGDNERADIISYNYYGDVKYTWLIYVVNNIVDPIAEWPKSHSQFLKLLDRKYGSELAAKSLVHCYKKIFRDVNGKETNRLKVDYDTYLATNANDRLRETVYDYEVNKNEKFRSIDLLEDVYVSAVFNEFKNLSDF